MRTVRYSRTMQTPKISIPRYMTRFEAGESARRMLQTSENDPSTALLALVLLYVSWEREQPSEEDVVSVLRQLPLDVDNSPLTSHFLLRLSNTSVQAALEHGMGAEAALDTFNETCMLAEQVFHGSLTFRETYLRTQALLSRSPGVGVFISNEMRLNNASVSAAPSMHSSALVRTGLAAPAPQLQLALVNPAAATKPESAEPADAVEALVGPSLQLFDPKEAGASLQRVRGDDGAVALKRLLVRMEKEHGRRRLGALPKFEALDRLEHRFPHFKEVLSFVRRSLALAGMGTEQGFVRVPPLLLRGEPGAGKSYFAQELAKALSVPYEERDLSVTSEAFVLMGMDSSWKNAKSGLVFEALYQGEVANPLVCLNEVDKARESGNSNSPISALYTLLEPANARRFKDEFVGVTMDASRIIWVLTANHGPLPEPILSRLEVFDIQQPSFEQCRQIAQSVWADLQVQEFPKGHGFSAELQEDLCDEVALLSPRIMRRVLARAAGEAALNGRANLTVQDILLARESCAPSGRKPSMGFLA